MSERNRLPPGIVPLIGGLIMAALCGFLSWLGGFAFIGAIIAGLFAALMLAAAAIEAS